MRGRRRHPGAALLRPGDRTGHLRRQQQYERSSRMKRRGSFLPPSWPPWRSLSAPAAGTTRKAEPRRETDRSPSSRSGAAASRRRSRRCSTKFTEDTGIETKYESARDFLPVIRTRLAAGNPPDVAIIPRPGIVAELARDDSLIPLEDLGLDPDDDQRELQRHVDEPRHRRRRALRRRRQGELEEHGLVQAELLPGERDSRSPTTWEDLLQITAAVRGQGKTPWAVGAQGRDNSWTLTDWFENIYARTAGADKYTSCSTATCRSTTRRSRTR